MFSTDQNIETIAQLIEKVKQYLETEKLSVRLYITEKLAKLATALLTFFVVLILSAVVIIFLGITLAVALSTVIGTIWGFLAAAAAILILLISIWEFKKTLIEKPLVKLVVELLSEDKKE